MVAAGVAGMNIAAAASAFAACFKDEHPPFPAFEDLLLFPPHSSTEGAHLPELRIELWMLHVPIVMDGTALMQRSSAKRSLSGVRASSVRPNCEWMDFIVSSGSVFSAAFGYYCIQVEVSFANASLRA